MSSQLSCYYIISEAKEHKGKSVHVYPVEPAKLALFPVDRNLSFEVQVTHVLNS